MVSALRVGRLVLTRDEGGVIRELQELDGPVGGGPAVCIQGE